MSVVRDFRRLVRKELAEGEESERGVIDWRMERNGWRRRDCRDVRGRKAGGRKRVGESTKYERGDGWLGVECILLIGVVDCMLSGVGAVSLPLSL